MSRINKISRRLQVARMQMKARGGVVDKVGAAVLKAAVGVFENFSVFVSLVAGVLFAYLVSKKDDILWQAIDKLTDENLKSLVLMLIYPAANWALLWFAAFSAPKQHIPAVLFLTAGMCWVHKFTTVDWSTLLVGLVMRLVFVSHGETKRYVVMGLLAVLIYYWYVGKLPIGRSRREASPVDLFKRRANTMDYAANLWDGMEHKDLASLPPCSPDNISRFARCLDDQGDEVPLAELKCTKVKDKLTLFFQSLWGEWCTCKPQRGPVKCLPVRDGVSG